MKSLEDTIRKLAKDGELSHISLAHSPRGGGVFGCSYRGASAGNYRHAEDADPVKAILTAITPERKRKGATDEPDFG